MAMVVGSGTAGLGVGGGNGSKAGLLRVLAPNLLGEIWPPRGISINAFAKFPVASALIDSAEVHSPFGKTLAASASSNEAGNHQSSCADKTLS